MKLATSNPHEESMLSTYILWGLTQRFQSYVPFFKTLIFAYREGVSIYFHSFQVNNMIFFMFWLIFCDKAGKWRIFITMNDSSSLYFGHPSFWAVWKWIMSHLKQLKSRSYLGPLVHWPRLCPTLDPPWALQPPGPQHHLFLVLKFGQLSALYDENEWCMLTSQTHPSQVHLLTLWLNLSWSTGF